LFASRFYTGIAKAKPLLSRTPLAGIFHEVAVHDQAIRSESDLAVRGDYTE
jgi:hypothetical protein